MAVVEVSYTPIEALSALAQLEEWSAKGYMPRLCYANSELSDVASGWFIALETHGFEFGDRPRGRWEFLRYATKLSPDPVAAIQAAQEVIK